MKTVQIQKSMVHICQNDEELANACAHEFRNLADQAVKKNGRFTVALSGGSTPPLLYKRLTDNDLISTIPWHKIHFFIGDERSVAEDSSESNTGVAKREFLSRIAVPSKNLHFLQGQNEDTAKSAADYAKSLQEFFKLGVGELPTFDLVLLGMGPDGHCASLFPGTKALHEKNELVVANHVEKLNTNRITFTYPVINNALNVIFMVRGADKSSVLAKVLEDGQNVQYPSQGIVLTKGKLQWFVEKDAAKDLACLSAT